MVPEKDEYTSKAAQGEASAPLRSLCIVIADDDRDAVLSLSMLLREEGHAVYAAHDAKEALDQVLRHDPDALLLDIALGRGSGFEVAHMIRARHGERRPMIIGVSGVYKKSSDRILADLNGFNHYLVKPYDPNALLGLLAPLRQPRRRAEDDIQLEQERTYRITLARAAGLIGGARRLSDRLGVSMADLTRWLAGEGRPPLDVFLRAVDILLRGQRDPPPSDVIPFGERPDAKG